MGEFIAALLTLLPRLALPLLDLSFGGLGLDFGVQAGNGNECEECPASAFTSIGAAWATQGYYVQADLLAQMKDTLFGHWATIIYVLAAIGALVMVGLGMPPKNYLWFFIGPGVYSWLVYSTQAVTGVQWMVANQKQDQVIVWRDAEVGLKNTNIVQHENIEIFRNKAPTGGENSGKVKVAIPFLFVDEVLSFNIQWLIQWTGVYTQKGKGGADENTIEIDEPNGPWYIMSNIKWPMIQNITAAMVRSPDLRDAFTYFLSSPCGTRFKQSIDGGRYAAAQTKGKSLPCTVFKSDNAEDQAECSYEYDYKDAIKQVSKIHIPAPQSLARLFSEKADDGSFAKFSKSLDDGKPREVGANEMVRCVDYLHTLVQGFRWESGHAYWQLLRSAPPGFKMDQVLANLFYGWNIREREDGEYASNEELHTFLKHLIFVHMVRNEMTYAPPVATQSYSPSQQAIGLTEAHASTIGSQSKFGELYQWVVLMPHLQGILIYFMTIAYPFACLAVIVPGWWKAIFTWMCFFTWVKLWDFGFAMVHTLERSVWAMIGNNSNFGKAANHIIAMSKYGSIGVSCEDGGMDQPVGETCAVPKVCHVQDQNSLECNEAGEDQKLTEAFAQLDYAMLLGAGMDLDLSNAYYIYIMTALYIAIPALTAQIVLGAKAGATSAFTGMFNDVAGKGGGAAGQGVSGQLGAYVQANQASVGQAGYASAFAGKMGNLAAGQLWHGNQGLDFDLRKGELDATKGGKDAAAGAIAQHAQAKAKQLESVWGGGPPQMAQELYSFGKAHKGLVGGLGLAAGTVGMFEHLRGAGEHMGAPGDGNPPPPIQTTGGRPARDPRQAYSAGVNNDIIDIPYNMYRYGNQLSLNNMNQEAAGSQADAHIFGAGANWQGYGLAQGGRGHSTSAQRMQSLANFEGEQAGWAARNSYGAALAGRAGALGLGNVGPGARPTNVDGMATGGYLGSYAGYQGGYSMGTFMDTASRSATNGNAVLGESNTRNNWYWNQGPDFKGYSTNSLFAPETQRFVEETAAQNNIKMPMGYRAITAP